MSDSCWTESFGCWEFLLEEPSSIVFMNWPAWAVCAKIGLFFWNRLYASVEFNFVSSLKKSRVVCLCTAKLASTFNTHVERPTSPFYMGSPVGTLCWYPPNSSCYTSSKLRCWYFFSRASSLSCSSEIGGLNSSVYWYASYGIELKVSYCWCFCCCYIVIGA